MTHFKSVHKKKTIQYQNFYSKELCNHELFQSYKVSLQTIPKKKTVAMKNDECFAIKKAKCSVEATRYIMLMFF